MCGTLDVCRLFAIESLGHGLGEIRFIDNVVAIEHRPRLPAAEAHDLALRHPATAEVAGRCAPEIVHEPAFEAGLLAGSRPGSTEALDALACPMEDEGPVALRPSLFKQLVQLRPETEGEHSGVATLRLVRVQPHHVPFPIDLVPREAKRLGFPPAGHSQ